MSIAPSARLVIPFSVKAGATLLVLTIASPSAFAASSITLTDNRWEQLVIPALTNTYSVGDLLGDDLPRDGYGTQWVIFTYDSTAGAYSDPGIDGTIDSGSAFWILQRTGQNRTIDIPDDVAEFLGDTSEACRSEYGCLEKDLVTDSSSDVWHMLGYPYAAPLHVSSVTFTAASGQCANAPGCVLPEASSEGLTINAMYYYSSASGEYVVAQAGDQLPEWQGFWFQTASESQGIDVSMLLPDPRACEFDE